MPGNMASRSMIANGWMTYRAENPLCNHRRRYSTVNITDIINCKFFDQTATFGGMDCSVPKPTRKDDMTTRIANCTSMIGFERNLLRDS
mmetsp:Transcript_10506/g.11596  ORF Transcript_10506/g.11596 Transcript_10506/m.11596 type:complete len:89 (+) Transcript_10506:754-1020(+)